MINESDANAKIKPWYARWWGIFIILSSALIAILAIAFGLQILNYYRQIKQAQATPTIISSVKKIYYKDENNKIMIEGTNNYSLGTTTPKLTIVEFGDFNCPLCKNSHTAIRPLAEKYKDQVKFIFRDFPVYEESIKLSGAARCAGEQGLFWAMHDKFYQFQGSFAYADVAELANQIGADQEKFTACLTQNKFLNNIKKDYTDATDLGVTGTPTWFFNGYQVAGDIPYDTFVQIIEQFLD